LGVNRSIGRRFGKNGPQSSGRPTGSRQKPPTFEQWCEELAAAVEYLIGVGHTWSDVRRYTLKQVYVFYRLAAKRADEEVASLMESIRSAAWADKKEFTEEIKGLRRG